MSSEPGAGHFTATGPSQVDLQTAIEIRKRRTIEHHNSVISIAKSLSAAGYKLYQRPYDCLAHKAGKGTLLIEMKTLDGSKADERKQSEKALGQLRGYSHFNVGAEFKKPKIVEVLAYTERPTDETLAFMRANIVACAWPQDGQWVVADLGGNISNFSPDALLS